MANQSIFAESLESVHHHMVTRHDSDGELCLFLSNDKAEFVLDFVSCRLTARCSLSLSTMDEKDFATPGSPKKNVNRLACLFQETQSRALGAGLGA